MEDTPLSLSCSDCQRHFPSIPELSRHRELLHPSPSQDSEEGDNIPRPYRCQQCGRGYRHSWSLVNHRRTHETGRFPCVTCGKDFTNPMALKSHIRTHTLEGRRRHRPPRPQEPPPKLQSETVAPSSWDERLPPREGWADSPGCESGLDPRTAAGTWEDPSPREKESWESRPDPEEGAAGWGPPSSPARAPPLPTAASSILSNLEQYLAESVVDFTEGQVPVQGPPAEEERRYKCSQCGKTYKHAGSLTNHRQSHTLGVYPCGICFKEFSNLMAMKNHARLHAQYRPYRCPRCPRAFRLSQELLEHQQSHEGERPGHPWEEKGLPTTDGHADESARGQVPRASMLNGSRELGVSGDLDDCGLEEYRPFRCADCGRTYRHAGSLINHRKSHQTGVYPCSLCSKQLFNAAALKNHIRAHHRPRQGTGDGQPSVPPAPLPKTETTIKEEKEEEVPTTALDHRPYKCTECGRAYRHRGSLVNHRHSHRTGEYPCSLCPRKYPNLMALRNHVRVHCKAARRSPEQKSERAPNHLKAEAAADPGGDDGHLCKREGEASDSLPAAADRRAAHVCNVCGMLFGDPKSLAHHSLSHGMGEKGSCRTETTTEAPPRTFACRDCGKSYRHSGSLINHRQTHQTGDFSCGACAKHFHTMAAMKSHLRRHSRRRDRGHRKQAGSDGRGVAKLASGETWAQGLEDSEGLGSPQGPTGQSLGGAGGTLQGEGHCLPGESEGGECGFGRGESCVQADRESRGHEEGLEGKEACGPGGLDSPGGEECHTTGFCDDLPGQDEDQKAACSTEAVSGWQAEGTHTCPDCGRSFPHAAGLLGHRPCHPPGIYQCSLCPKEFDSLPALRSHFRDHGTGEAASAQPFLCSLCGMIFPGRAGYRLHRRQAHSASSSAEEGSDEDPGDEEGAPEDRSPRVPPLQVSEAELLNQLQREVEALEGAGYGHICGCCGQTYDDLGSLERHHQSQSTKDTEDKPPSLPEAAGDAAEEAPEDAVASGPGEDGDPKSEEGVSGTGSPCAQGDGGSPEAQPRPFRCDQCGKTYRHGGSLVNHLKIHQTGDFVCPVCSRCFPNLAAYRNHLRNNPHCKGNEPQLRPSPEAGGSAEPHITAEAVPEQVAVRKLQEELKAEPLDKAAEVQEETWVETSVKEPEPRLVKAERPFSCEVCGRSYKHAGSLINHRQSHQTGHFGCQACSKGFSNLMSLKNHRRIHADPRRFRCSECGKAFRLRKQLANHQRVHAERRGAGGARKLSQEDGSFPCGQCGRIYRHASSLLNHRCSHQPGQHSYPKTCSNRMALKDHQKLHLENRRRRVGRARRAVVRCALCGRGFPGRASLERHLREHEEETKRELPPGLDDPSGAGGNRGSLADSQGLQPTAGGAESGPQLEQVGALATGDLRQGSIRATEPLSPSWGKAEGQQGDRALVNHHGAWGPPGQALTKPEDEAEASVCRSACRLASSQASGASLHQTDGWEHGDSSSPLQPGSPSCSQCGKADSQSDGSWNHNSSKTDCHRCLHPSKEVLAPVAAKSHGYNHLVAQPFACPDWDKAFQSHCGGASHLQTHSKDQSQVLTTQLEEARGPEAVEGQAGLPEQKQVPEAPSEPSRENVEGVSRRQGVKLTVAEDKDRPFCCPQCGRSYRHAGSLLNHQKAHTTGLYPCSLCPKLLPNLLSLKNHSRTHTDPKRHRCSICGKAFRTAARLEGHGRVHAPREGPFTCPHCPRHFRRRVSFLQHQQQHQEDWPVAGSGDPMAPAASRGDSSPPAPAPTTPLLDPSPQWPTDLGCSL
ncbi:zinc finger protein 646 [Ochotona curzoniae]|uniref:zinc finger protein 646 n=1 Tax=Ochotona curzoniae TaxID=130825 RepID=UPI001B353304|nr:zinc finger protein 646 [Ochotona curzoniae]